MNPAAYFVLRAARVLLAEFAPDDAKAEPPVDQVRLGCTAQIGSGARLPARLEGRFCSLPHGHRGDHVHSATDGRVWQWMAPQ